jgi:hypothetical protein
MTWVANELILEGKFHFFLECMRVPPDWHLWVYILGDERDAEKFQVTITLFREEEYGRMGDSSSFTAQRSYTGQVQTPLDHGPAMIPWHFSIQKFPLLLKTKGCSDFRMGSHSNI